MLAQGTKGIAAGVGDGLRRLAFHRSIWQRQCSHPADMRNAPQELLVCPGCERDGSAWVKLRMCLACGAVGCCDSSTAQHARRHHEESGHPVIRSIEPGEAWAWCYVDQAYLAPRGASPAVR
jgi:uncharacterized UBP type Zn finger protein